MAYHISPVRSARDFLLSLLIGAGLLSAIALPVGLLLGGWTGAIFGVALAVLLAVVLDGLSVREIRMLPGGIVEFRALFRQTRAPGSQIERVTGYLDEDEGTRSYNLAIAGRRREVKSRTFPSSRRSCETYRHSTPACN